MAASESRHVGKIKWFSEDKRYGFITPDQPIAELGARDLFVHQNALVDAEPKQLRENVAVSFAVGEHQGRTAALQVKLA